MFEHTKIDNSINKRTTIEQPQPQSQSESKSQAQVHRKQLITTATSPTPPLSKKTAQIQTFDYFSYKYFNRKGEECWWVIIKNIVSYDGINNLNDATENDLKSQNQEFYCWIWIEY